MPGRDIIQRLNNYVTHNASNPPTCNNPASVSKWKNHTILYEVCAETAEIVEHEYVLQRSTTGWKRSYEINARVALGVKKRPVKEAMVYYVGISAACHVTSRV